MSSEMPLGWYKRRDGSMRFWNGLEWGETTAPPATSAYYKKSAHRHWWHRR